MPVYHRPNLRYRAIVEALALGRFHHDVRTEVAKLPLQLALYVRKQIEHCRGRGGSHCGCHQGG